MHDITKNIPSVYDSGPPWFTKEHLPRFFQLVARSNLKLVCNADGEHPLKYQWSKDGKVEKYRRPDSKYVIRNDTKENLSPLAHIERTCDTQFILVTATGS